MIASISIADEISAKELVQSLPTVDLKQIPISERKNLLENSTIRGFRDCENTEKFFQILFQKLDKYENNVRFEKENDPDGLVFTQYISEGHYSGLFFHCSVKKIVLKNRKIGWTFSCKIT